MLGTLEIDEKFSLGRGTRDTRAPAVHPCQPADNAAQNVYESKAQLFFIRHARTDL